MMKSSSRSQLSNHCQAVVPWIVSGVAVSVAFGLWSTSQTPGGAVRIPSQTALGQDVTTPGTVDSGPEILSQKFRLAAASVLPAVVEIKTSQPMQHGISAPAWGNVREETPFGPFFPGSIESFAPKPTEEAFDESIGSGVIVDPTGLVLTNHHVVEAAEQLVVQLADGRRLDVADINLDPDSDLAVLRVDSPTPLPTARLGNSDSLQIGDWVLTLGSPLDLRQTVSAGIISARDRTLESAGKVRLLQTDAAINPGSSGGALVNLHGEVVGITTAIASRDGGYQGIGFAVPASAAKWVLAQLEEFGEVRRSALGIVTDTMPVDSSLEPGKGTRGVRVTRVLPKSPAHEIGIQVGDVILTFDGRSVEDSAQLRETIERQAVGSEHVLGVLHEGNLTTFKIVTEKARESGQPSTGESIDLSEASEIVYSRDLQLSATAVTPSLARQLGFPDTAGVCVAELEPQSPAYAAGIRRGMVIHRVGSREVRDLDSFAAAMEYASLERGIELSVQSREGIQDIVVITPR